MLLANSSPAAIEEVLVNLIQEALGEWKNVVKVKPFLQVEAGDADLSGNVNNAFGAIQLSVYGVKLFIPFIIANKKLLPFDTIRMGAQEVAYDYGKLRRIVNAIEHKSKTSSENATDESFQTMEVAKFDDIQPNNGFLGTIMNIRNSHNAKNGLGADAPWNGPGFGVVDEQRMMSRTASKQVDVFDVFHEVMEKIADVQVYSPQQMEEYKDYLIKQAEQQAQDELEKVAAAPDTMEAARIKRDMIQLAEERLFNVHRSASGNNIAFPTFEQGRFEYRMGRVYQKFESWLSNQSGYTPGKIDTLVIDSKGGYKVLKRNQPFMASTREPSHFEMVTERTKSLKPGQLYTAEKNKNTLFSPFYVESSYMQNAVDDGMVISIREDGLTHRTANSLFSDSFTCREIVPGKSDSDMPHSYFRYFHLLVSLDKEIKEPTYMTKDELHLYVTQKAKDPQDAHLALALACDSHFVLLPEDFPFFKLEKNITNFYTKPNGLFTEGPLAKVAAYEGESKATLTVVNGRNPKVYSIEWKFTNQKSENGATKLESRSADNLSKSQAQDMLKKLGFDYRTQAKFFEISDRNGRGATFKLPDPQLAASVSAQDKGMANVQNKLKGLGNAMLHSKNFMPMFEDTVAGGVSAVLSGVAPGSVDTAHKMDDFLNWKKEAHEVAVEIEKLATQFKGPEWHELSALLNMKYRLDKVATDIYDGGYLQNGHAVFEKVTSLLPAIEKKASDLLDFNRKQQLHTSSYLVDPVLVKKALAQLDGLYTYASLKKKN